MIFYLTFLIPIAIMFSRLLWKKARPVPVSVFIILLALFIISLGMWIATFYMPGKLYWRGFRSHCFIFLFMSLCAILFYLLYPEKYFHRVVTVIMSIVVFCFSLFSSWVCIFVFENFYDDVVYNDNKYRIEEYRGLLTMAGLPDLYVKKGLFETRYFLEGDKRDTLPSYRHLDIHKIVRTELKELPDNKVSISFYHSDTATKLNPYNIVVDTKK